VVIMEPGYLSEFIRVGNTTTNSLGVANVTFQNQLPYGLNYVVLLTLIDQGNAISAIGSTSNLTLTGFTINTRETKLTGGTYNQVPNIQVHWLVIPI
jgi:hypothetical protein